MINRSRVMKLINLKQSAVLLSHFIISYRATPLAAARERAFTTFTFIKYLRTEITIPNFVASTLSEVIA